MPLRHYLAATPLIRRSFSSIAWKSLSTKRLIKRRPFHPAEGTAPILIRNKAALNAEVEFIAGTLRACS
ncbi:MAG: hypothetical protein FJ217_08275 [Ignavibacteria bacterium]|nr:hypothetical protein [Ignavibacteria bacterium]